MKVSVLMPIYNTKEEYLRTAIESILNQTYKDYEFLIYDDASNIDLQSIVMSYNDERIIYKKFEKNQGISKIRNELVKDSRGEYLAIWIMMISHCLSDLKSRLNFLIITQILEL